VEAPLYDRPMKLPKIDESEPDVAEPRDYNKMLLDLLSSLNIASREDIVRVYDHEIMASTVVKPLVGKINRTTHGDAAVLRPLSNSYRGLAVTCDVNPRMVGMNPYWGSASAMDEACRNLAAVGARAHSFADNLNFGNPEKADRMGIFYESVRGLGFVARGIGVPFVSGNVSLYNEGVEGSILPTPTIFGIGMVDDIRKTCTVELKKDGNRLYVVGETKKELGGSEYYRLAGVSGGVVPRVDVDLLKRTCEAVVSSIESGAVAACHDVSDGGIAVAVAEMIIGSGGLGASVDVTCLGKLRSDFKLFSESNTRFVAEAADADAFLKTMKQNNVPFYFIGRVTGDGNLVVSDGKKKLIDADSVAVCKAWDEGIRKIVG
ncbi:MAG: AIR synthase-related protein, partial [archaeon]